MKTLYTMLIIKYGIYLGVAMANHNYYFPCLTDFSTACIKVEIYISLFAIQYGIQRNTVIHTYKT